jgi:hypothetical protein
MTPPSLPENFDQLEEAEPTTATEVFRYRLGYYRYVTNTAEYNKPHYDALRDPMYMLRSRLFEYAGYPWEGETLELKVALIQAVERWETLTVRGVLCPVVFDAADVRETTELNEVQGKADRGFRILQSMFGLGCPPRTTKVLWHSARRQRRRH